MQKEIIIRNPEHFDEILKVIREGGAENLHVLADFDRTLTTAFVDGKSVPSLISVLRDGNYLTPDYTENAHALFDKYHAIEIDPTVPFAEKWKAMDEWWRMHAKLLIESGLNKSDLEKVVSSGKVRLREEFSEFADVLNAHNVPLVIMSASGLGVDGVSLYLEHAGKLTDNVHIISNVYEWDSAGRATALREPIIHSLNKYETAIRDYPAFDAIKNRKNVILLGDSPSDIGMVQGFDYHNLLSISFFNETTDKNLKLNEDTFDVVLTGDTSMAYVNKILREVLV
ncbi:MAG: hypothetical protein AAB552_01185 [Patescibacteria group bacterium]